MHTNAQYSRTTTRGLPCVRRAGVVAARGRVVNGGGRGEAAAVAASLRRRADPCTAAQAAAAASSSLAAAASCVAATPSAPQQQLQQHLRRRTHHHRRRPAVVVAAAASAAGAFSLPPQQPQQPAPSPSRLPPFVTAAFTAAARTIDAHFLPFCLTTGVALGVLNPGPGVAAAALNLNSAITFTMFVIAGLQLRQGEAAKALRAKGALAYGLTSILLLTPLAAIPVLALPLEPRELALGLAVFCCMPTALSSGITFTNAVGGNAAVALLLTVLSNLAGVFTMPLLLPALLGPAIGGAALERGPLLARLVSCVLVPTLVGAAARAFVPGTAALIDANKPALARLSAVLLALVPWTQVSKTVSQGVALPLGPLLLAAAAGVAVHLAFLTLNISACRLLRLGASAGPTGERDVQRAVVLTASVKTLPVAVAVFASLAPVLGPKLGVALVPAMSAHLSQIVIDSLIVGAWKRSDAAAAAAASAAAAETGAAAAAAGEGTDTVTTATAGADAAAAVSAGSAADEGAAAEDASAAAAAKPAPEPSLAAAAQLAAAAAPGGGVGAAAPFKTAATATAAASA